MKTLFTLLVIGVLCTAAPLCQAAQTAPNISQEDLLAATITTADLNTDYGDRAQWWPQFPEFYDSHFKDTPDELFYIVQNYTHANPFDGRKIETALTLYNTSQGASDAFKNRSELTDKSVTLTTGPAVGDECRYFTRLSTARGKESTLRFRFDCVMVRITKLGSSDYAGSDTLASYAKPIARRLKWLLAGKLKAQPISAASTTLLPPDAATTAVGPVLGTARNPAEAWALIDSTNDPVKIRTWLYGAGAAILLQRRYLLNADPKQIVEAVLFTFPDAESAEKWCAYSLKDIKPSESLNPGRTGSFSGFSYKRSSAIYELTFAKGRYVADISAWSPFDTTTSACEFPVRSLGELWYNSLPGR